MFLSRAKLIPRYNWDYGLKDLIAGWLSLFRAANGNLKSFERVFGLKAIATVSGRASLYAILRSLELSPGSLVGVPLFCCPVVFDAVKRAGCQPAFIDITPKTYTMSPEDLAAKKGGLAAVVVVHMFGHPADMDGISVAAGRLPIIEDCAHSLYSTYRERLTGTIGEASFFSFRSGKYLSVGEGSVILARDPKLHERIQSITSIFPECSMVEELKHCVLTYMKSALYRRPWYGTIGYPIGRRLDRKLNLSAKTGFRAGKARISDLALMAQRVIAFEAKIDQQRRNALYLLQRLSSSNLGLPFEQEGCRSNYYQFAVRLPSPEARDAVGNFLFSRGIDSVKYLDEIVGIARGEYGYHAECPEAENCSKTVLVIPNQYTLSEASLARIADSVQVACARC